MPKDPDTGRYSIEHDGEAAWALARLGVARSSVQRIERAKRDAKDRYDAWARTERREPDRNDAFFTGLLVDWWVASFPPALLDGIDSDAGRAAWDAYKPKSISFPTGRLWARYKGGQYVITDGAAYTAWVLATLPAPEREALKDLTDHAAAVASMIPLLSSVLDLAQFVASAPSPDHGSFTHPADLGGRVLFDGEIVPGLAWASASIEFGASPDLSIEHPAWAPAPEGSTIPDSAPDAEAGS